MKKIYFKNEVLIYYGNPAGYRMDNKVILDAMFDREELKCFLRDKEGLEVEIKEGIYDRISVGDINVVDEITRRGTLEIYQLRKDTSVLMRFISLAEREKRGFGLPQKKEYEMVYEEEIDSFDLESIWEKFRWDPPKEWNGHMLSISDVLVLTKKDICRSFYVDATNFKEITF